MRRLRKNRGFSRPGERAEGDGAATEKGDAAAPALSLDSGDDKVLLILLPRQGGGLAYTREVFYRTRPSHVPHELFAQGRHRDRGTAELTDRTSASAKYLSRIEVGKENPTRDLLFRLADSLNVEPYEMLYLKMASWSDNYG